MKIITKYLKPYWKQMILCLTLLMTQAFCNLALPGLMSDMVNVGIVEMNHMEGQQSYILGVGGRMLLVTVFVVAASILVGYLAAKISAKVAQTMRHDVFSKVEHFSVAEFDKFSTASLITRTTNDIQQIQNFIGMAIRIMGAALIMGIGGIVLALGQSPSLSWVIALAVIVLIGFMTVTISITVPKFTVLQKLVDKLNLISREGLSGIMVVRAFGNETHEEARFEEVNTEYSKTNRFVQRIMSGMMPAMTLIMNLTTVAIVWFGGKAIAQSTLQIGDMMAFIQYAMQIIMAFLMISIMFVIIPRSLASAQRIQEVLETDISVKDSENIITLQQPKGRIEFKNVSFRYEGAEENVLNDISFTAKPGQTTAFIGSTGSGKSTLINLIPRFYDVTEGQILFDGVDVRDISQEQLHDQIGYIPQKGILFSGTISSNIRTGKKNADENEIYEALEQAQASDFIKDREEGIYADISQGGANVSGGQKQRLSIARALVKKAPVYIFDDSFSALDYKTDAKLRAGLAEHTGKSTVLIVAQRVSTIKNADQIVVLDKGEIVGIGTHGQLLRTCMAYQEIAESQLTKGELA